MAVDQQVLAIPSQRRAVLLDKSNIKLRPGQYLIKTPEIFDITKGRRGEDIRTRRSYSGTAYGVKFENNVAVIDDESVREIREVMLDELEGDEDRLPPWFRDPEGSVIALARKLQSDFGYEITPELPKLKRLTKQQIAASAPYDAEDEKLLARAATDQPGEESNLRRATPRATTRLPGVDDAGSEDGEVSEMPAQPTGGEETRPARPAPVRERIRATAKPARRGRSHKKKEPVSG